LAGYTGRKRLLLAECREIRIFMAMGMAWSARLQASWPADTSESAGLSRLSCGC
jgi:hypothetical protein